MLEKYPSATNTNLAHGDMKHRFPVLSSRNRNTEILGSSLVSESSSISKHVQVSEPEVESSSKPVQSRNRVPKLDSLKTGLGIEKTGTGNL